MAISNIAAVTPSLNHASTATPAPSSFGATSGLGEIFYALAEAAKKIVAGSATTSEQALTPEQRKARIDPTTGRPKWHTAAPKLPQAAAAAKFVTALALIGIGLSKVIPQLRVAGMVATGAAVLAAGVSQYVGNSESSATATV